MTVAKNCWNGVDVSRTVGVPVTLTFAVPCSCSLDVSLPVQRVDDARTDTRACLGDRSPQNRCAENRGTDDEQRDEDPLPHRVTIGCRAA